jgi:outer membrane lipoprotein-sorting protein
MRIDRQRQWLLGFAVWGALSLGVIAPAPASPGAEVSANIRDYVASRLDDFTADLHLVRYDADAGHKITKDFGRIYDWMKKMHGDLQVSYKEPDKMRLDGRLGASKGTFIVNETKQIIRVPNLGLSFKNDFGDSPGKRKTLLDMGLISEDYLSYTQAEFRGARPYKGVDCAVFNISYRDKTKDTSHRLVWIDPRTRVTLKREEYSQEGKLLSIWYYHDPHEVSPGVFMPSSIEIDDSDGEPAGETAYKNIRVNQGIADTLFQ